MAPRRTTAVPKTRSKPRQLASEAVLEEAENDTQYVTALARGLELLDAFKRTDSGLGNRELSERTGLSLPTVSRLTYTLMQKGYLDFDARRREYRLGIRVVRIGSVAHSMTNTRTIAFPLLQRLADETGFNVALGTFDQGAMVFTDVCEGSAVVGLRLYAGSRLPVLTTSMGRAYLASLSDQAQEAVLTSLRGTVSPDAAAAVAKKAKRDLKRQGFCISAGEWQKDISAVAAPIQPSPGQRTYVCMLGGPSYLLPLKDLRNRFGPRLADVVQTIEKQLIHDMA